MKNLVEGEGITLTESGDDIIISADAVGGDFDGTRTVVTGVRYDTGSKCLQVQTVTVTISAGLITAWGDSGSWSTVTGGQAVQES